MNKEILETVSNNHQEENPRENKEDQEKPELNTDEQRNNEKQDEQKKEKPKTKRGRPTVYARDFGREGGENLKKGYNKVWPKYALNSRSMTNLYYVLEGIEIVQNAVGAEKANAVFMKDDRAGGRMYNQGILEQIGRMKLQNHFDDQACYQQVTYALEMLEHGATCHGIAKRLRWYRNLDESNR